MNSLENIISNLSGFKISNTHFRIGSKIHISDFYYAKRFFQNGFFSSRIAFLLAKDIITLIEKENKLEDIKNKGLTIIGYEMYSELLIGLVDKFLRKRWNLDEKRINHNLYEDVENLKLCKKNNILDYVIIIVPIASTFSTSIKIEKQILLNQKEEQKDEPYIFRPHFNVLYVSDGVPTNNLTKTEKDFGFVQKNINLKNIVIEAIFIEENEINRTQKYYLSLPTKWYNVEDCQICNPVEIISNEENENLKEELPLYETDRTAVTPAIIFEFPKGIIISKNDLERKFFLDIQTITYSHHTRNNAHFLYSINSELFLERNKFSIQNWLLDIKESTEFKNVYKETDRVIIISVSHYSNVAFISLVNDFLFASSANIIHYNPNNDYVQNFKIVYGQEINDADKIFFVDDSLKSGSAFDKIYQFVQNTIDFSNLDNKEKGIIGCFFLINKSQLFTFNNLKAKLIGSKLLYAFANLHLFTSLKPNETSPLQIEEERYKELMSKSFLDSTIVHFQKQANKLSIQNNLRNEPNELKENRHLKMLIATHRINQYFTITSNPKLDTFFDFLNDLFLKTESPIEPKKTPRPVIDIINNENAKAYLKVLTQSPFTQYKPLKDHVFKWTNQLLINHINYSDNSIIKETYNYDLFDTLKFLIRRVGLLNSNILISKFFIKFLLNLYSPNGIPKILNECENNIIGIKKRITKNDTELEKIITDQNSGENKTKVALELFSPIKSLQDKKEKLCDELLSVEEQNLKLNDFCIFYVTQIKELLLRNESRCLRVEKKLKDIESDNNPYIKQIVRLLREENSLIIAVFYKYISGQDDWKKTYIQNKDSNSVETIEYTNDRIIKYLNRTSISKHHRFQDLNTFFSITNQLYVLNNKNLLNYLWLQYFLSTDKFKKINLNFKTELILKKLMQMFIDSGVSKPGAFFIVNDSKKTPFVAFNKNHNGISEISESNFKSDDNKYLEKFFRGEDNSHKKEQIYRHYKTIIELERNKSGNWIDLFAISDFNIVNDLSKDFISEDYNRLVLLRLNKRVPENSIDKTQGIIGFYYYSESQSIIDINVIRYLLLLRPSLSRFIENHHENDEFRDWQIAQIKQKTSLLTGHGREMLINIAINRGNKYQVIVHTLLTVQRLLIDKKEESDSFDFQSSRIKKIFNGFFQKKDNFINASFFNELSKMTEEIFSFNEIENKEDLETPILNIQNNLTFRFDKDLLNMICFEILVNAKKNRWLFSNETITDESGEIYEKNKIWIEAKIINDKLIIEISNTGPEVGYKTLGKIKKKKNIKRYDNYSGIELIDTIMTEFDLGEINFSENPIKDRLAKFTTTITLNQNSNGK